MLVCLSVEQPEQHPESSRWFNGLHALVALELVVGHHNAHSATGMTAFTKWCPVENGIKTFENAEAAVDLALERMGQKQIPLLQCQVVPK